jgi:spore coat protein U-like protein
MRTRRQITTGAVLAGTLMAVFVQNPATSAATATANLSVTATVTTNCTITTSAVAFGSYDPIVTHASANLDQNGSVTITCTKGAATTIALDLGNNASGSVRRMKDSGTNYMAYELYQEAGRTTVCICGRSQERSANAFSHRPLA